MVVVLGVSFGSLRGLQSDALTTAFRQSVLLTLAIGIQNIPEGLAISVGYSLSFLHPQLLSERREENENKSNQIKSSRDLITFLDSFARKWTFAMEKFFHWSTIRLC
jgi:hypothetical protein